MSNCDFLIKQLLLRALHVIVGIYEPLAYTDLGGLKMEKYPEMRRVEKDMNKSEKQITIRNCLTLRFDEGFRVMNAEEKRKLPSLGEDPSDVLNDPERHIIISMGWKKVPHLTSLLYNTKDAVQAAKKSIKKPMQAFGYCHEEDLSRNIAGEAAEGFCYEYETQGIGMFGETYVFKYETGLFYLHFYTRTALKEENLKIWNDMLDHAVLQ